MLCARTRGLDHDVVWRVSALFVVSNDDFALIRAGDRARVVRHIRPVAVIRHGAVFDEFVVRLHGIHVC